MKNGVQCPRCRAAELGLAGPFTPREMLELGLVVFPEREEQEPSAELAEAQLRVSVALIGYEDAQRDVAAVAAAIADHRARRPRAFDPFGNPVAGGDPAAEDLSAALDAANGRLRQAGDRLRAARRAEREIAARESEERRQASLAASLAQFELRRAERAEAASRGGLQVLDRIKRRA